MAHRPVKPAIAKTHVFGNALSITAADTVVVIRKIKAVQWNNDLTIISGRAFGAHAGVLVHAFAISIAYQRIICVDPVARYRLRRQFITIIANMWGPTTT